jgi:hypothetical protein
MSRGKTTYSLQPGDAKGRPKHAQGWAPSLLEQVLTILVGIVLMTFVGGAFVLFLVVMSLFGHSTT